MFQRSTSVQQDYVYQDWSYSVQSPSIQSTWYGKDSSPIGIVSGFAEKITNSFLDSRIYLLINCSKPVLVLGNNYM